MTNPIFQEIDEDLERQKMEALWKRQVAESSGSHVQPSLQPRAAKWTLQHPAIDG